MIVRGPIARAAIEAYRWPAAWATSVYGRSKSASPPSCTGALYRLHAEASGALADGCNINRRIDELVEKAGFELEAMDHFRGDGPAVLSSLYRGTATRD